MVTVKRAPVKNTNRLVLL